MDLSCFPTEIALTIHILTVVVFLVVCVAGEIDYRRNKKNDK
jgi:hypothetical protein